MLCIYLQVHVRSQRHGSSVLFAHLLSKDGSVESDVGLDARLIVHVHNELLTTRGSHHIHHTLISSLSFEEILHTNMMYPYINLRMCNECDIFNNIVRGRHTHRSCFICSVLLLNSLLS
jgi:hypothetical protein